MKTLLVAECNPYGGDPYYALYPAPDGCAGHRLCTKVMGLSITEYLRRFDRVNLCHRDWKMKEARAAAARLEYDRCTATDKPTIILLGRKVCGAFETSFEPFTRTNRVPNSSLGQGPVYQYVILPHPSGLSRAWNEPGAYDRARTILREAGVL